MQTRPNERPMKRAMIVGGVASFIRETATPKLARWGFAVELKLHVDMDHARAGHANVPSAKADVVIVFREMVHNLRIVTAWQHASKLAGVPCLVLSRKESHWADELKVQGYEPINPNTAAAVAETEEDDVPAPDTKKPTLAPVPPTAPGKSALEEKLADIKVLLMEARDLGLLRLNFDGTTGKLTTARQVLVEEIEEL